MNVYLRNIYNLFLKQTFSIQKNISQMRYMFFRFSYIFFSVKEVFFGKTNFQYKTFFQYKNIFFCK